jgi:CDP-glucose 4,6-dehydratase
MVKFWKDKNVFVTGCSGLLGSWLVKDLCERGANVVGLIRDWVPKSNLVWSGFYQRINVVRGNLADCELLERVLNEYEIEIVFHLGAQTIVEIARKGPLSTFESNIKGTWSVLEACRHNPSVKRIIVASSDKAYGYCNGTAYEEEMPLKGDHPYDVSKSCADLISQSYAKTYGLPVCITRCGNFIGGGDLNFNRIVPGTIRSVLNNERPIIRSDGSYVRDYIYVLDAVDAYMLLAEKMLENNLAGEAFNFGYEKKIIVLELVEKILKLMNRLDLKPVILNEVRSEIKVQILSAEKARHLLQWQPRYSLEKGLKETIDWYREFLKT